MHVGKKKGVLCNRRIAPRVKGKIYTVAVRPAMVFGLETLAYTKKAKRSIGNSQNEHTKIFSFEVTRLDKIRNTRIKAKAHTDKKLRQSRLRRYGHIMRREEDCVEKKILEMEPPGKRRRRPARRYMNGIKEDMEKEGIWMG